MLNKLKNYLDLIRFFNPTGTFLLLYPLIIGFLWLEEDFTNWKILFLFAIGTFLMRSSGCIINDLCDVKFDRNVARTKARPLASGKIVKFEAISILVIFLLLALSILLEFNKNTILFGISLIIPISIYPLTKRFFKYPQFFLGATFNLGIFLLWLALSYDISWIVFAFYMAFISWTIGYDTIYAYQDIDDDKNLGLNSTAINFGKYGKNIIMICYALFFILLLICGITKGYGFIYFLLLNFLSLYVISRIYFLDLDNHNECSRFFKFNNIIGISLVLLYLVSNIIYTHPIS